MFPAVITFRIRGCPMYIFGVEFFARSTILLDFLAYLPELRFVIKLFFLVVLTTSKTIF